MSRIDRALTIGDLRELARRRTPGFAFEPMETGSESGQGPVGNVAAFDRYRLGARALVDMEAPDTSVTLFGRRYARPFGISAIGHAGLMRRHADEMFAEAAAERDLPFLLSGGSCASLETICRIAPGRVWQQLYLTRDPAISDDMVRRGRDAGVEVLVVTVDLPAPFLNHWAARRGLRMPVSVPFRTWPYVLAEAALHPGWTWDVVRHGGLPRLESFSAYAPQDGGASAIARFMAGQFPSVHDWRAIERVRALWPGALIVKGVMDPRDALLAIDAGADAVTVSNHGGNKFDAMLAAVDQLVPVVGALAGRAPVLFDGGLRRGSDLVVALGLGAAYCMVGRAALYGALAGGTAGVLRALDILTSDLARTQVLMGCPTIAAIDPALVTRIR